MSRLIYNPDICVFEARGISNNVEKQILDLLPKHGKTIDDPSCYLPLSMINTSEKQLVSIICKRLKFSIETAEGLSNNQFDFMKPKSTIDAINVVVETASRAIQGKCWRNDAKEYCEVVILNVKNTFNICDLRGHYEYSYWTEHSYIPIGRNKRSFPKNNPDKAGTHYRVCISVPQIPVHGPLLWMTKFQEVSPII